MQGDPAAGCRKSTAAEGPGSPVLIDWPARAVDWRAAGGGVERERLRASSRTNIRCNHNTAMPTYLMDRFLGQLVHVCM